MANERFNGTIKYWNARKGFGFIAPETGDEQKQVFVHIKAFKTRTTKPTIGQTVNYIISTDDQGRTRAEDVIKTDEESVAQVSTEKKSSVATIAIVLVVISVAIVAFNYLT